MVISNLSLSRSVYKLNNFTKINLLLVGSTPFSSTSVIDSLTRLFRPFWMLSEIFLLMFFISALTWFTQKLVITWAPFRRNKLSCKIIGKLQTYTLKKNIYKNSKQKIYKKIIRILHITENQFKSFLLHIFKRNLENSNLLV